MRKMRKVLFLKLAKLFRGEKNVVPCIIGNKTKIVGNIVDGEIVHIDGKLEGDVCCRELVIGPTGNVMGSVKAKSLDLYGSLNGSISVENLFIASSAKFYGDSVYKTIAIEPGAELEGKYSRQKEEKDEKVVSFG